MTFNDLEGQNHIAYSVIRPNMNMHAEYQVKPAFRHKHTDMDMKTK